MQNHYIDTPHGRLAVTLRDSCSILVSAGLDTGWFKIDDRPFYAAIQFKRCGDRFVPDARETCVSPAINGKASKAPANAADRALAIEVIDTALREWLDDNSIAMAEALRDETRSCLANERRQLRNLENLVIKQRAQILMRMNQLKIASAALRKAQRKAS